MAQETLKGWGQAIRENTRICLLSFCELTLHPALKKRGGPNEDHSVDYRVERFSTQYLFSAFNYHGTSSDLWERNSVSWNFGLSLLLRHYILWPFLCNHAFQKLMLNRYILQSLWSKRKVWLCVIKKTFFSNNFRFT